MKAKILLAPLASVVVGALFAAEAGAITVCSFGNITPLPGTPQFVNCTNNVATGSVFGSNAAGVRRVTANLTNGAQLDVVGLNQNNTLLRIGCSARDVTPNGSDVRSPVNSCVPDDPGEVFQGINFNLYRP